MREGEKMVCGDRNCIVDVFNIAGCEMAVRTVNSHAVRCAAPVPNKGSGIKRVSTLKPYAIQQTVFLMNTSARDKRKDKLRKYERTIKETRFKSITFDMEYHFEVFGFDRKRQLYGSNERHRLE
jgi:hypothetical protein